MLDAFEDYVSEGGRFIYMGGNGFYWVVYYDEPWCLEVRKLDAGMRAWALNREYYMQTTGKEEVCSERSCLKNSLVGFS